MCPSDCHSRHYIHGPAEAAQSALRTECAGEQGEDGRVGETEPANLSKATTTFVYKMVIFVVCFHAAFVSFGFSINSVNEIFKKIMQ